MDPVIQYAIATGLSLLFALAAIHKMRDPAHFAAALAAYRLLPSALVPLAAALVIVVEAGAAVAVWVGPVTRPALWAMAGLLSVYWVAIAINLARGRRDIDCGCSGPAARQSLSFGLLLRNGVLIVLAATASGGNTGREMLWLDWISIAAAVAAGTLLYAAANRLLAQAPRLALLRSG